MLNFEGWEWRQEWSMIKTRAKSIVRRNTRLTTVIEPEIGGAVVRNYT